MTGRQARNLVAAAEEMPAAKYGYKPTPAQMSYGDIIGHLAEGNDYFCSSIGGVPAPKRAELAKRAAKDKLVARLKETFQFCETALAKVDDAKLDAKDSAGRTALDVALGVPGAAGGRGRGGQPPPRGQVFAPTAALLKELAGERPIP